MWLPNNTPEYWSAREREMIAKHDQHRLIRAARGSYAGDPFDGAKVVAVVLAACRSAVTRFSGAVRALRRSTVQARRLGNQRPAPERG